VLSVRASASDSHISFNADVNCALIEAKLARVTRHVTATPNHHERTLIALIESRDSSGPALFTKRNEYARDILIASRYNAARSRRVSRRAEEPTIERGTMRGTREKRDSLSG